MNDMRRIARIGLAAVLVLMLATLPAAGDWLVTSDGEKIETRGAWEVRSRLVVFTSAEGVLSSMRLSDCDLAASEAATAAWEARTPPPRQEPERRAAVLVLTDADVGHVRPDRVPDSAEPEEVAPPAGVVVGEWRATDEQDGVAITGILRNDGSSVAADIKLGAIFRDADGDPIENRFAVLSTSTLRPGQKAQFSVPPFGLFSYSRVEFDIQHFGLLTGGVSPGDGQR